MKNLGVPSTLRQALDLDQLRLTSFIRLCCTSWTKKFGPPPLNQILDLPLMYWFGSVHKGNRCIWSFCLIPVYELTLARLLMVTWSSWWTSWFQTYLPGLASNFFSQKNVNGKKDFFFRWVAIIFCHSYPFWFIELFNYFLFKGVDCGLNINNLLAFEMNI